MEVYHLLCCSTAEVYRLALGLKKKAYSLQNLTLVGDNDRMLRDRCYSQEGIDSFDFAKRMSYLGPQLAVYWIISFEFCLMMNDTQPLFHPMT